jgi:hypothetical protein
MKTDSGAFASPATEAARGREPYIASMNGVGQYPSVARHR